MPWPIFGLWLPIHFGSPALAVFHSETLLEELRPLSHKLNQERCARQWFVVFFDCYRKAKDVQPIQLSKLKLRSTKVRLKPTKPTAEALAQRTSWVVAVRQLMATMEANSTCAYRPACGPWHMLESFASADFFVFPLHPLCMVQGYSLVPRTL